MQPAFAYVVREGVTNVMRHSQATPCEIRIGPNWIEVHDNGATARNVTPGNCITGLSVRLAAVGGSVTATREPDGTGFVLRAFVPKDR
ncbi:MAG: hypothetical protein ACRD0P_14050 [Stackebrandtia sp.]